MKKICFLLLISILLASCSSRAATPAPSVIQVTKSSIPATEIASSTSTSAPPTETPSPAPSPTDTAAPPTETITPVETFTPFIPQATQPPPKRTTNLNVNVLSLSKSFFEVPANSDLTVSDTSSDRRANPCLISNSSFRFWINIPVGSPTKVFQLPAGVYKLSCGIPSVAATITSK